MRKYKVVYRTYKEGWEGIIDIEVEAETLMNALYKASDYAGSNYSTFDPFYIEEISHD